MQAQEQAWLTPKRAQELEWPFRAVLSWAQRPGHYTSSEIWATLQRDKTLSEVTRGAEAIAVECYLLTVVECYLLTALLAAVTVASMNGHLYGHQCLPQGKLDEDW